MDNEIGKVLAIALRSVHRGPMFEVPEAQAYADDCLKGDHGSSTKRGLTMLASVQWRQAMAELGADLPWHTRRANVLIDADTLEPLIGRTIRVGRIGVRVHAETKPCGEMDRMLPGLTAALTPDCRAGVYGQILNNGVIRVADVVSLT